MIRVLVVDDSTHVARAMRRGLEAAGAAVDVLFAPEDAVEAFRRGGRWDVVLSDVTMPGMWGTEMRREIVALAPEMSGRFVFMTGGVADDGVRLELELERLTVVEKISSDAAVRAVMECASRG